MSRQLRFKLPATLNGGTADQPLSLAAKFQTKGLLATVSMTPTPAAEKTNPFSPDFNSIDFLITCDPAKNTLDELVADPADLLGFIVRCSNRVLSALRNSGLLHTSRLIAHDWGADNPAAALSYFDVATRAADDEQCTPQFQLTFQFTFESLLAARMAGAAPVWPSGNLTARILPDIEEAIETGREPSPEDEFYVHALEHLYNGNLRMAVVEAVICLELCVARWMNLWLTQRAVQEKDIGEYFSKDVGIAARVAVMVPLMLYGSRSKPDHDQAAVLRLIKYRNAIAHKTGRLDGVKDPELRSLISEGMKLAFRAARETKITRARPRLTQIERELEPHVGRRIRFGRFSSEKLLRVVHLQHPRKVPNRIRSAGHHRPLIGASRRGGSMVSARRTLRFPSESRHARDRYFLGRQTRLGERALDVSATSPAHTVVLIDVAIQ